MPIKKALLAGIRITVVLLVGSVSGTTAQSLYAPRAPLLTDSVIELSQSMRPRTRLDLTLNKAIERALDRNLDIAVERLNPQLLDLSLAQAQAFYRPTLRTNFTGASRTNPSSTQLDGGLRVETDSSVFNSSIRQPVNWGGGAIDVSWNNNRTSSTNAFTSFNPSFRSTFAASYSQPLLRGFRIDSNRQRLKVTLINREISDIDLEATIANTVAEVQSAYWDLRYSVASLAVQQQALELAEQLVRDNRARVEIGTLAPIDVLQAQSEAAARRQTLAQAKQIQRTAELALKRLLLSGTDDELWAAELNPIDPPAIETTRIDIEAAVRTALDQRTDVSRVRRQQEINDINVRTLRNNTLPALDLVGTYQLAGQGGTQFLRQSLGGTIGTVIPGGFSDAIDQLVDVDFPAWTIQLNLTYPLGQNADEIAYTRARLQVQQTEAQIRQLELQVALEVTNAALQIDAIQTRIDAATAARDLADQQLRAEGSKFDVGMSTNFFIVQAQRDLSAAQDVELRAILDYQKALIEFDRLQRTSLNRAGISVVGGSAP